MSETTPTPHELWVQAGEDGDRYRQLLREHGHVLWPGGTGHAEGSRNLPCGWPGNPEPAKPEPGEALPPTAARPACEHYWAYHCYGGMSVRLCQTCHEPDWDSVRAGLEAAAAAERERIAQLADTESARGAKTGLDRIALRAFAQRLRKMPMTGDPALTAATGALRPEVANLRHALREAAAEMDRRYEMGAAAERKRIRDGAAALRFTLYRPVTGLACDVVVPAEALEKLLGEGP